MLTHGARWAVEKGYGTDEDLEYTEEHGAMAGADLAGVSARALEARACRSSARSAAGNHFLEIQDVDEVYRRRRPRATSASAEGQITVMIHTGSRGLGLPGLRRLT